MPPAVRLSDKAACPADAHGCPACPHPTFGPLVNGSPNVMINKLPAIRLGDPGVHMACCGPNQYKTAKGSSTVYVNRKPLVRMGDKTTHCGGSGTVIMGSPNVFADDGGLSSAKVKNAKAKDGAKGDPKDGKYDGKTKDKNGNWVDKEGKGNNKTKKAKDGGGGGQDDNVEPDDDRKEATGEVQSIRFGKEVGRLGEKIPFTVDCGSAVVGTIKVLVFAVGTNDRKSEVAQTSVEARLQAQGSFQVNKLDYKKLEKEIGLKGDAVKLAIEAEHKGKKTDGSNHCFIADKGTIVFALFDEQGGTEKEPVNTPESRPVRVTKAVRQAAGGKDTPPVKAKITIKTSDGQYTIDAEFNDDGIFRYAPKGSPEYPAKFPKDVPAGTDPFPVEVVEVKVDHPQKFGAYKVRAYGFTVTAASQGLGKVSARPAGDEPSFGERRPASPPGPAPAPTAGGTITGHNVIIAGATSVNDPGRHDKSGWNFLNAAANRAKDIKKSDPNARVTVIMYSPENLGYQKRGSVEGKGKDHYENTMKKSAKKNGFELIIIRKGDQLTPTLNTATDGQIKQLEYFGHSNAKDFLLEYSSDQPGQSTDYWGMTKGETAGVRRGIFAAGGAVNLYGCNLGESGGLAQDMKTKWGQKTTASDTKTDFETNVGRLWKPTGNYKEIK